MWIMVLNSLGYSKKYDDAIPGNIVIVPTGVVKHPTVKCRFFNRNYLLFGVVADYIYTDWEIESVDEEWDGVVRNHEQLRVNWVKVARKKYEDWDIVSPSTKWV